MGRSIVRDPRVFLFDEPLSNLDAKLRVQMRTEIKDLHARLRTTTVYVTHDQIEAMTLADRIVVLREGRVEQMGAPLDLYDRPANLFVAGFIGSPAMNVLDGEIAGDGVRCMCRLPDGTALPVPPGARAEIGQRVRYGIRPEHLVVCEPGVAATVVVVEPTGAETQVAMRLGGQDLLGVFRERLPVRRGDLLPLGIDPAAVHLFDAATGTRL
jgi:multiple sugar transport system ATP-binding protein